MSQPCQRFARNYGDMKTEIPLIVLLAEYQGTRDSLQRIGDRHGVNGRNGMAGCHRVISQLGIVRPSVPAWRPTPRKALDWGWRGRELDAEARAWASYERSQTTVALTAGCSGRSLRSQAYYLDHEKNKARTRAASRKRYGRVKHTAEYKIKVAVRNAMKRIVMATGVSRRPKARTQLYLGCTYAHARAYLTPLLRPGMAWANHGRVWEIDHKRPLASFDLREEAQRMDACHYTNLQPLFKAENRAKSDRWDGVAGRRRSEGPEGTVGAPTPPRSRKSPL